MTSIEKVIGKMSNTLFSKYTIEYPVTRKTVFVRNLPTKTKTSNNSYIYTLQTFMRSFLVKSVLHYNKLLENQ